MNSDAHSSTDTTHFGFETVPSADKARKVASVFDSVAAKYDVMNDLMSLGLHRVWKAFTINQAQARPGYKVLDVAGGTGDLSLAFARLGCQVWLTDINAAMLARGRDRLVNRGQLMPLLQCDAQALPFPNDFFDRVTVAFGLRNMTDKKAALVEMCRVLKPGGSLLVLEFSKVVAPLEKLYDAYSFKVLPWLGQRIAGDADSYRYLAESIRMHPDQTTLRDWMLASGFGRVDVYNMTGGVAALHQGFKF